MGSTDQNSSVVCSRSSLLLPFCQYLTHRIKSDNVNLLKRIFIEFLDEPQRLPTVESMLRLSFPVVALLPVDMVDASHRIQAGDILSCMKFVKREDVRCAKLAFQELEETLRTTIELKNWSWLARIFDDFCAGEERCLVEFIRLQRQAISIIPVAPMAVRRRWGSTTEPTMTRASSVSPASPVSSDGERGELSDSSDVEALRQAVAVKSHKKKARRRSSTASAQKKDFKLTPELQQDRDAIFKAIRQLEASQPWEDIFDVSNIEYPFDAEEYSDLATSFKWFWETHAQAVWERPFWYPSARDEIGDQLAHARQLRQERAANAFTARVIVPAYKLFGPQFFVDLDNRSPLFYWWWYRRPFVNIFTMGKVLGLKKCLAYIRSGATERHPYAPKGFEVRAERHGTEIVSMWSLHDTERWIKNAIEKLKKETQARSNRSGYEY